MQYRAEVIFTTYKLNNSENFAMLARIVQMCPWSSEDGGTFEEEHKRHKCLGEVPDWQLLKNRDEGSTTARN